MHSAFVILCVLGLGLSALLHEHHLQLEPEKAGLPAVTVTLDYQVADSVDVLQPTIIGKNALNVGIVCRRGEYKIQWYSPGEQKKYQPQAACFISKPTTSIVADTIFQAQRPDNDSLVVYVESLQDTLSLLFTGFSAFDTR